MYPFLASLLVVALIVLLVWRLRVAITESKAARASHQKLAERFAGVVDADAERERVLDSLKREQQELKLVGERERATESQEIARLRNEHAEATSEIAMLKSRLEALRSDLTLLDEEATLQSFGFYKPHYNFPDSSRYAQELERIRNEQKRMLKEKTAAACASEWTVNGSKVEGRKQITQTLNLMLRAFNGESDASVTKVKYNNVGVMEARIRKAYEKINGLAQVQRCSISTRYLDLKLQELFLAHEYQEKQQEEKDEQRRIREQMREEEIAQRELDNARREAEQEEERYEKALVRARAEVERAEGEKQARLRSEIEELQAKLLEARANKERAIARAQLTRSGNVYIISNVGSFGEDIYKIGMTRRLDPNDRVRELSGAAVPFDFDVHAMIYSDDAPALENILHNSFLLRRVNRINERREFFKAGLDEIVSAAGPAAASIEVTRVAEAKEYRKTLALIEDERRSSASPPAAMSGTSGEQGASQHVASASVSATA
jgi:hypothetical protein